MIYPTTEEARVLTLSRYLPLDNYLILCSVLPPVLPPGLSDAPSPCRVRVGNSVSPSFTRRCAFTLMHQHPLRHSPGQHENLPEDCAILMSQ